MKFIALATLALIGIVGFSEESKAQTVRDNSGQTYFANAVRRLCGSGAQVWISPHSAEVLLSDEYLENRNLDEIARNLALDGLNVFPESDYFWVKIQDSKGSGYARVNR